MRSLRATSLALPAGHEPLVRAQVITHIDEVAVDLLVSTITWVNVRQAGVNVALVRQVRVATLEQAAEVVSVRSKIVLSRLMVVATDRRHSTSLLLLRLGTLRLQVQYGLERALRQVVVEDVSADLSHVHLATLLQLLVEV